MRKGKGEKRTHDFEWREVDEAGGEEAAAARFVCLRRLAAGGGELLVAWQPDRRRVQCAV
jgi:hypothetical protein